MGCIPYSRDGPESPVIICWRPIERRAKPPPACAGEGGFGSIHQVGRDLAAILRELLHHGLVKRDILLGTAVRTGMHIEFRRQFLARCQARLEPEQLEEVDDRGAPVARPAGGCAAAGAAEVASCAIGMAGFGAAGCCAGTGGSPPPDWPSGPLSPKIACLMLSKMPMPSILRENSTVRAGGTHGNSGGCAALMPVRHSCTRCDTASSTIIIFVG
jgi:hypothetical protein